MESPATVLGISFRDLPQRALVVEAAKGVATIEWIDGSAELTAALGRGEAAVALFPPANAAGESTSFLIIRCLRAAPLLAVAIVAIPTGGGARHLRRCWARGSHLLVGNTAEEIRAGIRDLVRGQVPAAEFVQLEYRLERLFEADLARLLLGAARAAPRRLSANDLARINGVSVSTMRRRSRRAGWPPPSELVEWGRVMRLALSPLRSTTFSESLARRTGFGRSRAMRATCQRLLKDEQITVADITIDIVLFRLRGRVGSRSGERDSS